MKKISKITISVMLMMLMLFNIAAVPLNEETPAPEIESTYDSNAVDWENIDQIIVLQYDGNCEFIQDAISKGIDVVFDTNSMIATRGYTYFTSLSWITRNGELSLSMMPQDPVSLLDETKMNAAWAEAVRFFEHHPLYTAINNSSKYNSMYNQFVCHVKWPNALKTPWNLEPIKEDKGYAGFVLSGCN